MCNSNAYNLSCVANKTNDKPEHEALFSRMMMKAMSPNRLFESLMVATKSEAAESKDGKKQLKDRWLGSLISNFGDDEGNEGQLQRHRRAGADDDERQGHQRGHQPRTRAR